MRLINLAVKNSDEKGRGVFATEFIAKDGIIEMCPIIKLDSKNKSQIDQTELYDYYFLWDENNFALALGYGSLYNHSSLPNASYHFQKANNTIIIKALENILPNNEIFVDYTNGTNKVWWDKKNNNSG